MRLFVSVDLPDDLTEEVAAVQDRLEDASGLDFTDPAQAHVTMKFLGETPPHQVDEIVDALETAVEESGVAPFEATYGGLGVFPSLRYISVVWLGVSDGEREFERLHAPIESELVDIGFDEADHEFTPHVTLARMNHAGGKDLVQRVVREESPVVWTATVGEVQLTESTLTSEGPVYETVASVPLE
ncbi:RNA 2',3'-cyclic phosphodiesterase [Halanaeroarchaeum sulfurireducens]|uniref:RNA 2',3'-cyclic phosphodiesterase n=1 Tax=Halanaeroarchaeum sulfurireducens TaxID=1604004 RepID=A0A0N9N813_9EURY|nr:RNA 2',3'-cyclic phosphodiesterase [Halanaeroarchaeum sulfurireducens]ALG83014.1 2'-5' RNA ligase [Halanaeroarchaeum sulfurireducens]